MADRLTDPRAYLQERVALFTGVTAAFFAGLLALDFATPGEGEAFLSSTRLAIMAVLAGNGAVWLYTRTGERSMATSRALELLCMADAMVAFSLIPLHPPLVGAGGVMTMFVPIPYAIMVVLRAALIPSPTWLSVAIAAAWGALLTVTSTLGWEGLEITMREYLLQADRVEPWVLPLSLGLVRTVAYSFVAGVISHIVHGLQAKVRKAMDLGQYTLESKLGEGGMGVVYRAHHRMLRRPTAVKLLPPDKIGEKAIARFEQEVRQTSRLSHPNTVAIYDFGRTQDGVFYYAMELLDGVSLQELVAEHGPLPPERVVHVLAHAAEALAEAHGMNLIHRDVKPDNIMLCERGAIPDVVKVLDFGLVKDTDKPADPALSGVDTVRGTPLYMAPEALTHPDDIDGRADLYALGATGYFLLTGHPVFEGSIIEILAHHLHSEPPPLDESIDATLAELVLACLAKDPSKRPDSAQAFADALRASPLAGSWTRERARRWWQLHPHEPSEPTADSDESATIAVALS